MERQAKTSRKTNGQEGAAMVVVLLISSLLLVAAAGIILATAANSSNVTDALAEQQAYNAAESGVQAAINALRRKTLPSPLIDSGQSASSSANKLNYARAVNLSTSNKPDDPSSVARLSRWINYNYTSSGASYPDRVTIGQGSYDPRTGMAYSVALKDPDNPTKIISLNTRATIGGSANSKTFLGLLGSATIAFEGAANVDLDTSGADAGVDLGTFVITRSGLNNVSIPQTNFEITVQLTAPFPATVKLRGKILAGTITAAGVSNVLVQFDVPMTPVIGSIIAVPSGQIPLNGTNVAAGRTNLGVSLGITISLTQPRRLVIRSVGYGPRGATKVLEAIVQRDNFDGLIPATVTLVGNTVGSLFNTGSGSLFSGDDIINNQAKLPPIGTINGGSGGLLSGLLPGLTGLVNGTPADLSDSESPDFLRTAVALDAKISQLRETATAAGRYFSGGTPPPDFGNNADGTGITFIDGNATLSGAGGGILVVTGKLTLNGAFNFNGTIFATGSGGVARSGTGTGTVKGNMVVAPYSMSNPAAGFLPPKYDVTGALSGVLYNANNLLFGSDNYSTVMVAIAEK